MTVKVKKLDYNPDKEAHVEHKFVVSAAMPGMTEVSLGDETFKFDRECRFMMSDEKKARELQEENHGRIAVTRVRYPSEADRGHRYFFGRFPGVPWAKYDELGRRLED